MKCRGCPGNVFPVAKNNYLMVWKDHVFCCLGCYESWEKEDKLPELVKTIDLVRRADNGL